jgi:hypothetical protein
MAPPKRAHFSLNLDTEADHVYQRVEDHDKDENDRVKVLESSGPTVGNTWLEFVTKPFEKVVNRAVEGVIDGTGKKVHTAEGEIEYETHRSEKGHTKSSSEGNRTVVKKTSNVGNRSSESKKNRIWEEYDTSDL